MNDRRVDIQPLHVAPIPRISMRVAEAAAALGVSESWLRREAKAGRVPSFQAAGVRLFVTTELHHWAIEQHQLDKGGAP